jgi:ADP-heptose:LPS heptosyltransferase
MSPREELLIVHPGALGDVLQAVPALRALREAIPARLVFAGQPRLARLLMETAVVDEALALDTLGLSHLFVAEAEAVPAPVRERLARFDRVVSWFGARDAVYPTVLRALIPRAMVASPVPDPGSSHGVWEHLCATVDEWTGTPPSRAPTLAVPGTWREDARRVLAQIGADAAQPLLVVHAGTGARWKRWQPDKLARAVARRACSASWHVVVHEGPADAEAAEQVLNALARIAPDVRPFHLRAPPLDLLAGVLGLAHTYLGADSGVSHLAAAVGARAVIVYPASTVGQWVPWSPTAIALAMTDDDQDLEQVCVALAGGSLGGGAAPSRRKSPSIE